MGCKESKPRIQPVDPADVVHYNINIKKTKSEVSEYSIDQHTGNKFKKNNKKSKSANKNKRTLGSNVSIDDERSLQDSERGTSATSKFSAASGDSGLGGYDNGTYDHMITEDSDPDKVRQIEDTFSSKDLDLGITGTACPVRLSAKDKDRLEESLIIQNLREEGLITRPKQQSSGGTAFEIIDATDAKEGQMRHPPRLAKLEKRRKKKKTLTEDEIREKLEKAERRKKKKEQERLNKIQKLEKVNVNNALEQFEISQKNKEDQVNKKIDQVSDNRERRMKQIQDKMRQREEHAAMVRKRKELAALEGVVNNPDEEFPSQPQ